MQDLDDTGQYNFSYSLATTTIFAIGHEYSIWKWRLFDSSWVDHKRVSFFLNMVTAIWYDDAKTKIWFVAGRSGPGSMGISLDLITQLSHQVYVWYPAGGHSRSYFMVGDTVTDGPTLPVSTMDPAVVKYSSNDFLMFGGAH